MCTWSNEEHYKQYPYNDEHTKHFYFWNFKHKLIQLFQNEKLFQIFFFLGIFFNSAKNTLRCKESKILLLIGKWMKYISTATENQSISTR